MRCARRAHATSVNEATPAGTRTIASYHAHVYFLDAGERARALALRAWVGERFRVQLGRVHDVPIGPHSAPMYQIAFASEHFQALVPWLMLNRLGLSVLVHPNTGRARDDHLVHALWLGSALPVRAEVLPNDLATEGDLSIVVNTQPHLTGE